jgi:flagellar hook-associated protein 3 FlgL
MQLGQQGLSDLTGASGRAAIAATVDAIRTNLAGIANTQVEGKYIFGGTNTVIAPPKKAFDLPAAGTVTYNGNSATYSIDVSSSSSVQMNIPGSQVFLGTGGAGSSTVLFQAVTDLRDGLNANNSTQIQDAYNRLQAILPTVSQAQAQVGARESGLTSLQNILSSQNQSLQSIQNTVQDTNYPETITQFTSDQTGQNATLSALGKTNQPNLFNYLG